MAIRFASATEEQIRVLGLGLGLGLLNLSKLKMQPKNNYNTFIEMSTFLCVHLSQHC